MKYTVLWQDKGNPTCHVSRIDGPDDVNMAIEIIRYERGNNDFTGPFILLVVFEGWPEVVDPGEDD